MMTPEEKAANRIAKILANLKCYQMNNAKNRVAKIFQQMVRWEAAARNNGVLTCVTCGRTGSIGENSFDAGHFMPGRRASTIFHEQGCHPQCKLCNTGYKDGTPHTYEAFMVSKYGAEFVEEFKKLHRKDMKFTHADLAELQYVFEQRLKAAKAACRD